jgi:biopolymer transport protein ExbB/TolQ
MRSNAVEMAIALLLLWLLLGIAAVTGTARWSRRLWKKRKDLSPRAKAVAVVVASSALVGALGGLLGLLKGLGEVDGESLDPAQKARILAEVISEEMNWTACGIVVWLPSAIALLLMTRKRKAR